MNAHGVYDISLFTQILNDAAAHSLTTTIRPARERIWSTQTDDLYKQRKQAIIEGRYDQLSIISKAFRKSKRQYRSLEVVNTIQNDLDLRSKWLGLKFLRKPFTPNPYHRTTQDGKPIPQANIAEAAARHLSATQWATSPSRTSELRPDKVVTAPLEIETGPIDIYELNTAINAMKNEGHEDQIRI